jgi:hypothetical protein
VQTAAQLLALRLVIGILLGTDYVVSKALLTEFTPRAFRGRIMSTLSVAWAGGYTCAYFVGYALADAGVDAWRWMLVASAVPCLLILPLRLTLPESPLWLVTHGRAVAAAAVVRRWIGPDVSPPSAPPDVPAIAGRWAQLVSPRWRRRTIVACTFFTCQVIPYFAVGTFVTRVLEALEVGDSFVGGLVYNFSLLFGAVLGLMVVDRMPRRTFLVGSFAILRAMLALLVLTIPPSSPSSRCSPCSPVLSAGRISVTSTFRSYSPPTCARRESAWRSPPAASARRPVRSCCRSWWLRSACALPWEPASSYSPWAGWSRMPSRPKRAIHRSIQLPDHDGQQGHGTARTPAVSPVLPDVVFLRTRADAYRKSPARASTTIDLALQQFIPACLPTSAHRRTPAAHVAVSHKGAALCKRAAS